MEQNRGDQVVRFEQKDQYVIEANSEKNRITFLFTGDLKSKNDIPHIVEHTEQAITHVTDGYTLMAIVTAKGAPGFSSTAPLKETLVTLKSKNYSKAGFVMPKEKVLQRMTTNVVVKLSGINGRVFDDKVSAEAFLDSNE
jgi:hypothetical protein